MAKAVSSSLNGAGVTWGTYASNQGVVTFTPNPNPADKSPQNK